MKKIKEKYNQIKNKANSTAKNTKNKVNSVAKKINGTYNFTKDLVVINKHERLNQTDKKVFWNVGFILIGAYGYVSGAFGLIPMLLLASAVTIAAYYNEIVEQLSKYKKVKEVTPEVKEEINKPAKRQISKKEVLAKHKENQPLDKQEQEVLVIALAELEPKITKDQEIAKNLEILRENREKILKSIEELEEAVKNKNEVENTPIVEVKEPTTNEVVVPTNQDRYKITRVSQKTLVKSVNKAGKKIVRKAKIRRLVLVKLKTKKTIEKTLTKTVK